MPVEKRAHSCVEITRVHMRRRSLLHNNATQLITYKYVTFVFASRIRRVTALPGGGARLLRRNDKNTDARRRRRGWTFCSSSRAVFAPELGTWRLLESQREERHSVVSQSPFRLEYERRRSRRLFARNRFGSRLDFSGDKSLRFRGARYSWARCNWRLLARRSSTTCVIYFFSFFIIISTEYIHWERTNI